MKKLFFSIIALLTMPLATGCSQDGYNEAKVRQAIIQEFKTTDVAQVPNTKWRYIVRKTNGEVWVAEVMGAKAEVTASTLIFPASTTQQP